MDREKGKGMGAGREHERSIGKRRRHGLGG